MAKRSRKQPQRPGARRAPASGGGAEAGPGEVSAPRRRVERVSPAAAPAAAAPAPVGTAATATLAGVTGVRPRPLRHQPAGFIEPLGSDDPAVPFDRVPYVPADLRRVALIATIMIALIVVADVVVSNVVR